MIRAFYLFFVVMTALLLAGCGDNGRTSYGAKSLDKANANFHRIQASYELIETGEIINFDYPVSAYNRDVVGSYSGVFFPHVMFQKSPRGQAIAIDPPRYYHRGGVERRHKEEMPAMMWYPDANDLTYGESYLSSDAYHSPRAKVRILSYSVTQSNRKAYNKWLKSKIKEDNDGANHPWSLGCVTDFAGDDGKNCSYQDITKTERVVLGLKKEGNGSIYHRAQWLLVHGRFGYPKPVYTAKVTVWPKDVFARYMAAYDGRRAYKKRYYCLRQELYEPLLENMYSAKNKYTDEQKSRQKLLKEISNDMRRAVKAQTGADSLIYQGRYLSLPVVQGKSKLITMSTGLPWSTGQFPIAAIYPAVDHSVLTIDPKTQEPDYVQITQILMTDEWRGFGLPSTPPITKLTDELPVVKPTGKHKSEVYINDELICGSKFYKKNIVIYDLKLGRQIRIKRT